MMDREQVAMDALDQALLAAVQEEFPIASRPYEALGRRCGASEAQAQVRITRMRREGVIRWLGPVLDSRMLGMISTLAGADVAPAELDYVTSRVDAFPEVTNSHILDGWPNLWFSLVAPSQERIDAILAEARSLRGVLFLEEFPTVRVFRPAAAGVAGGRP